MAVATAGGVGFLPWAPGTWGSALAIPIFVLLSPLPVWLFALTVAALVALGAWSADGAEAHFGRADDGRIVIDEVAGQLIALGPLLGPLLEPTPIGVVTAFVLFRVLDVWKPWPIRWIDREAKGGWGVMLDDVMAGAIAALVLAGVMHALVRLGAPGTGLVGAPA